MTTASYGYIARDYNALFRGTDSDIDPRTNPTAEGRQLDGSLFKGPVHAESGTFAKNEMKFQG